MQAAITTDTGGFEVTELPDPAPRIDEVVVRVAACGVCGSDLKARPFMPAGTVMGHELGGEVVAVGADAAAQGWREGDLAAALPVISCGTCVRCAAGDVAHCSSVRFIGMGSDGGGFAEFAVVPARHAFPVPHEIPPLHAALVEPFAVGLHAVNAAEIAPGDEVLVIGAGGVGLTTVAWARARGAGRVTAVDPDAGRREAARATGAHDVLASLDDALREGYDAAIECVGHPELVAAAPASVRARGRVVVAGACDRPIPVEPVAALLKELTFRFSVCYRPSEFRTVIDAFSSGVIDPSTVIGPVVELGRLDEAFDLVRTTGTEGRVLVTPLTSA
ncbi:MAG TPA: alcohol dehydrogenase catalytic domain-containing protein [Acidimicrobiales bacterium]|nr:alcohol dehydrogenase catalytic domain-containing protein [Acidimicrobiales bacterium]